MALTPLYETADTITRSPVVAVTNPQPPQNTPLPTVPRATPPPHLPTTSVPTTTGQETTRAAHGRFYMTSQWWDPWDPPSLYSVLPQFQFLVKSGSQGPPYQGPPPLEIKTNFLDRFFTPGQKEILAKFPYTNRYRAKWENLPPYSLTHLGQANYSFFVVNPQAIKQLRAWDETDFQRKFDKARLRIRELNWVEGNTTKLKEELGPEGITRSAEYGMLQRTKHSIIHELYYTEAAIWSQVHLAYLVQMSIQAHAVLSQMGPQKMEITRNVIHELTRLQDFRNNSQRRGVRVMPYGTYDVQHGSTTTRVPHENTMTTNAMPIQTTSQSRSSTSSVESTTVPPFSPTTTTIADTTPRPSTTTASTPLSDTSPLPHSTTTKASTMAETTTSTTTTTIETTAFAHTTTQILSTTPDSTTPTPTTTQPPSSIETTTDFDTTTSPPITTPQRSSPTTIPQTTTMLDWDRPWDPPNLDFCFPTFQIRENPLNMGTRLRNFSATVYKNMFVDDMTRDRDRLFKQLPRNSEYSQYFFTQIPPETVFYPGNFDVRNLQVTASTMRNMRAWNETAWYTMLDQAQEHLGIYKAAVQRIRQLDRMPVEEVVTHATEYQQQVALRDEAIQRVYELEEDIWRMMIKGYLIQLSIQVYNWLRAYNHPPVNPDIAIQMGQIQVKRERIQQGGSILPQRPPAIARELKEPPLEVQVSMTIHKKSSQVITEPQTTTTPQPLSPTPSRWPANLWALEDMVPPNRRKNSHRPPLYRPSSRQENPGRWNLGKNRQKRQDATGIVVLVGVAALGAGMAYRANLEDRRNEHLEEAIKFLSDNQQKTMDELVKVENSMIGIVDRSLLDYNRIRDAITELDENIATVQKEIADLTKSIRALAVELKELHMALFYLSYEVGKMIPAKECALAMYEFLVTELEFLLRALDNLANGYLTHNLIQPHEMQRLITDVDEQIKRDYPGYTVLLKEVRDYYDLPLSRYAYHQGYVLIQVPVYVQQYAQVPLDLFDLKTVLVPFNVHDEDSAQKGKRLYSSGSTKALAGSE